MKEKIKKWVSHNAVTRIFFEGCSIVFAILFALALNEWNDNRHMKNNSRGFLNNISIEMELNLKSMTKDIEENIVNFKTQEEYFKKSFELADNTLTDNDIKQIIESFPFTLKLNNYKKSAWRSSVFTQAIRYFNPAIIQQLDITYDLQEDFQKVNDQLLEMYASVELFNPSTSEYQIMANFAKFSMYFQMGQELVNQYSNSLILLKEELKKTD